jgi:hypothetical protein
VGDVNRLFELKNCFLIKRGGQGTVKCLLPITTRDADFSVRLEERISIFYFFLDG